MHVSTVFPSVRRGPLVASLAVSVAASLALAAPSPAGTAGPPQFTVAPGARLYVPAPAAGRAAAWVVFRTRPHVNARLTVVRVAGRSGRSYAAAGDANCVRSAVPAKTGAARFTAGRSYRVSFYARAGTGRSAARKLVTSRELTARTFDVPALRFATPHC